MGITLTTRVATTKEVVGIGVTTTRVAARGVATEIIPTTRIVGTGDGRNVILPCESCKKRLLERIFFY